MKYLMTKYLSVIHFKEIFIYVFNHYYLFSNINLDLDKLKKITKM